MPSWKCFPLVCEKKPKLTAQNNRYRCIYPTEYAHTQTGNGFRFRFSRRTPSMHEDIYTQGGKGEVESWLHHVLPQYAKPRQPANRLSYGCVWLCWARVELATILPPFSCCSWTQDTQIGMYMCVCMQYPWGGLCNVRWRLPDWCLPLNPPAVRSSGAADSFACESFVNPIHVVMLLHPSTTNPLSPTEPPFSACRCLVLRWIPGFGSSAVAPWLPGSWPLFWGADCRHRCRFICMPSPSWLAKAKRCFKSGLSGTATKFSWVVDLCGIYSAFIWWLTVHKVAVHICTRNRHPQLIGNIAAINSHYVGGYIKPQGLCIKSIPFHWFTWVEIRGRWGRGSNLCVGVQAGIFN